MHQRFTSQSVTFRKPFVLRGELCPPGTYDFETEEELVEGSTFTAYRSVRMSVRIARPGFTEVLDVRPDDLARAMAKDKVV